MTSQPDLREVIRRLDVIEERIRATSATVQRVSDRAELRQYAQIESLIGLYRELDGLPALPPLRRWAISPDSARELHHVIRDHRPGHIVECGSGASTILLGHLVLAGVTDRVTSLEHHPVWYEQTRQRLVESGLDDAVDLVFAPLTEHPTTDGTLTWYDVDPATWEPIDLVIVDGPPNRTGPNARHPAVPLLLPRCNPGCQFVVDDYIREEEQAMVQRWIEEFPLQLARRSEACEKWLAVVAYEPAERKATS